MLKWLKQYLGLDELIASARCKAHLSEDAARHIAESAAGNQHLILTDLKQQEGDLVWIFRTPSVGSWLSIQVRDRDGVILGKRREGKR